jgi:hypothetical protein
MHQVCVEAVRHGATRDGRFWLGAFGQNLGLEGCAVTAPDELFGVFHGVHRLLLVDTLLASLSTSIKMGWPDVHGRPLCQALNS